MPETTLTDREIFALERPAKSLLHYYALMSLFGGPFFFVGLIPLYFRYHSLRYRFDEEGVSMTWGVLFRREIHLTYARIQDIHLVSNIAERWLGLARIKIQTASGSSKAEMTIEGVEAFEALRDFLYTRMRGARPGASRPAEDRRPPEEAVAEPVGLSGPAGEAVAQTLREVAEELRALRAELASRRLQASREPAPAGVAEREPVNVDA